ncbi:MAG: mechanosensitive ion channel family protein [Candidatus Pacebacteria bacterium]|nr:mechanosensitive ion channel family protein [Candidatus Paceibacterota bacterium]MDD2796653.1 mechanosensitive ion channel family protein [Candidatus Paceibacterota bacterium]MDD3048255.1 mechanosensitive ion channel family protein [Candidatus Paceibacterota bacterium]MDD3509990.1 mechanosensitive ion channel family protein [Candidatus Paceibacterota bacterium]MDD3918590.1 mechanosensitive ion channel family protein [Candidatus Paceibacterota bacterium]
MIKEFFLSIGTPEQWKLSIVSFFGLLLFFKLSQCLILNNLKKLAEKTKTQFDDFLITVLSQTNWFIELVFSLFISSKFLNLSKATHSFINYLALVAFIIFAAKFSQKLVKYFAYKKFIEKEEDGKKTEASTVRVLSNIADWGIGVLAILLILQNSGIDIGALLAGLGILGIAVAFALKEVLADLFACFIIYFDRPFEVGDYVILSNGKGTIKKIGLRTTRVRTLRGEELVISNRKLTDSYLKNFKKMRRRRVTFELYVDAKTSNKKLEQGKELIRGIIEEHEGVTPHRIVLSSFNGNSWTYKIIYHVETRSYKKYVAAHEHIILSIRKAFDKSKIKFATDIHKIILKDD